MTAKKSFLSHLSFGLYRICISISLSVFGLLAIMTIVGLMVLPPSHLLHDKMDHYISKKKSNFTMQTLPDYVVNAFIAIEDRRFYNHFGIDPIAITRAFLYNLEKDERAQGGSTITQQLARNMFLHQKKTYQRKLQEVAIAFWLEANYSKQEILTAYLKTIYFGEDCFGLKCASSVYFRKKPVKINQVQAAMLAGLLRAPNYYSPYRNKRRAWQRTKRVLRMMHELNYLTDKDFKKFSHKRNRRYLP